jgi:serine/threonine protein kinase
VDDTRRPSNPQASENFGISLRLMNDGTMGGGQTLFNPAKSLLPEGSIVQERYRIIRPLGSGGMGAVYLAEHILFHRNFALKTLDPNTITDISWRRFQKEAHAASMLDHPSLIKVTDFGIIDGRQPYFVMDFFEGITLSSILKNQGSLSQDLALDIVIKVCDAIGYAHGKGVIHRDLKPSNVMLARESSNPEVKIVDFGLAKLTDGDIESTAMTKTGEVFGTAFYMSPEQCLGKAVDHRADIYSVGCLLFELLTGTPPFDGDAALPIMLKHQSEKPPSLKEASLGKSFPKDLESVVAKLLEKEPGKRYQTLPELSADLRRIRSGEKLATSAQAAERRGTSSSRRPVYAIVAFATIAIAGGAMALMLGAKQQVRTTPPVKHVDPLLPLDNPNPTNAPRPLKPTYTGGFFSEIKADDKRVFHFPFNLEESPGRISELPRTSEVSCEDQNGKAVGGGSFAYGNLTIQPFAPFRLTATDYLCTHPQMFKRFRPDEIRLLRLNNVSTVTDETLQYVSSLTNLEGIELDECEEVTDRSLKYIDKLPKLEILTLGRTKVTGDEVAKLKRLRHLTMLDLRCVKHGPLVVEALKNTDKLHLLGLRMTKQNDQSLATIGTMNNLEKLDLSYNDFSNEGLAELRSLTNLTDLDVSDCSVRPDAIELFAPFKRLKHLRIDLHDWTPAEVKRLENVIPQGALRDSTSTHTKHSTFSLLR